MPDCCALKDIWRQLLTLIFHQTFNFKINMRQQCDFNEMYVNVNIQRINLWEFKKRESCILTLQVCWMEFHLDMKSRKHDDIFFECSMMENRLHLCLMTHQDLSLGHDVFDTISDLRCTFMLLKTFYCVMFGINLTSFISLKRINRYSI